MAALDATQKAEIYHTLYQLNSAFAAIVGHCDALRRAGALTPKYTHLFHGQHRSVLCGEDFDFLRNQLAFLPNPCRIK